MDNINKTVKCVTVNIVRSTTSTCLDSIGQLLAMLTRDKKNIGTTSNLAILPKIPVFDTNAAKVSIIRKLRYNAKNNKFKNFIIPPFSPPAILYAPSPVMGVKNNIPRTRIARNC